MQLWGDKELPGQHRMLRVHQHQHNCHSHKLRNESKQGQKSIENLLSHGYIEYGFILITICCRMDILNINLY